MAELESRKTEAIERVQACEEEKIELQRYVVEIDRAVAAEKEEVKADAQRRVQVGPFHPITIWLPYPSIITHVLVLYISVIISNMRPQHHLPSPRHRHNSILVIIAASVS